MHIKELLQLAGEQGKVVVIDEQGDVKGLFLSMDAYHALSGGPVKPMAQKKDEDITERINREILKAQLQEDVAPEQITVQEAGGQVLSPMTTASSINSLINERAEELFKSMPYGRASRPVIDMRAEVIDPNYNFDTPDGRTYDDEEIKPNFDNI